MASTAILNFGHLHFWCIDVFKIELATFSLNLVMIDQIVKKLQHFEIQNGSNCHLEKYTYGLIPSL